LLRRKSVLSKLNIFRRVHEIELQNKKQAAAIMKLCMMYDKKNKGIEVSASVEYNTAKELIDYILKM